MHDCYLQKKEKCKRCEKKTLLLEPFSKEVLCNACCNNLNVMRSKKKIVPHVEYIIS